MDDQPIVYEGPRLSKREMNEPPKPVVDRFGNPRYTESRRCWCKPSASTECRFHSQTEPGWASCPTKGTKDQGEERILYATNPQFGKKPEDAKG